MKHPNTLQGQQTLSMKGNMITLKLTNTEADFICWQESYYLDNVRHDLKRASRFAWREAIKQFPHLANFKNPTP